MKYNPLGRSDIKVSEICLGTMTWGTQNSEAEGHEQMSYAIDHGVNFFDTAEMYPAPPTKEKAGETEAIIGTWFEKTGRRGDVVLATKVSGAGYKGVREGAPISGATMVEAIEASLKRLKTDYVDLYQLHWPNRGSYHFRQALTFSPSLQEKGVMEDHVIDVLQTAQKLKDQGKIREFGLSNESTWGTAQFLKVSEQMGLPRMQSMQNEYSLMHRIYDLDLAELSHHEDVGCLAYTSLAGGWLSGKYQNGQMPEGSRRTFNASIGGRISERSEPAAAAYLDIAKRNGLNPVHMAYAFALSRPFMTSVIIGATHMDQLKLNLQSVDVSLSDEVLAEIQKTYEAYPHSM